MPKVNNIESNMHFFAASNSVNGFYDNFNYSLDRGSLKKLFIIKGGPGTGKSSLMKKVIGNFANNKTSAIWCSSDPSSLDGVIIEGSGGNIALVDGTAPHEMSTTYPGAQDEIINIGECFITDSLESSIGQIRNLSEMKGKEYKLAYSLLSSIGRMRDSYSILLSDCEAYNVAEEYAASIYQPDASIENSPEAKYIISCFNKDGYSHLPLEITNKQVVAIPEHHGIGYIIIDILTKLLKRSKSLESVYLNPLFPSVYEGVASANRMYFIDKSACPIHSYVSSSSELKLRNLDSIVNEIMQMSMSSFAKAMEHHFNLERIYTRSVNFNKLNDLTEKLIERIGRYL